MPARDKGTRERIFHLGRNRFENVLDFPTENRCDVMYNDAELFVGWNRDRDARSCRRGSEFMGMKRRLYRVGFRLGYRLGYRLGFRFAGTTTGAVPRSVVVTKPTAPLLRVDRRLISILHAVYLSQTPRNEPS